MISGLFVFLNNYFRVFKMQHKKSHAREGRGMGNGYNENWQNSPLWDSIEKKKRDSIETKNTSAKSVPESNDDERTKIRKLYSLAY